MCLAARRFLRINWPAAWAACTAARRSLLGWGWLMIGNYSGGKPGGKPRIHTKGNVKGAPGSDLPKAHGLEEWMNDERGVGNGMKL
jgi:hypothetical protein